MCALFALAVFEPHARAETKPQSGRGASTADRPNIIFILCDDLGWGDLGCFYQNTSNHDRTMRTPMLDRMAEEGLQMRAHYCPAPVCAPSRGSLLTGTHQGHCEIRDNQFDKALPDVPTLGTVMAGAGYRSMMIGKYGLQGRGDGASTWPAYPTRRGFSEFFGSVRHTDGHLHYPAEKYALGDSKNHTETKQLWHNDREIGDQLALCYSADLFTAKAKQTIMDHSRTTPEQPFFLYLAYDTPHAALQVPSTAYPEGSGVDGGLQWIGTPGRMINTATGKIDSYRHGDYVNRGWTDVEERFATMVRRIDNCVGDLLQTLRDLDIDERTLVVFSSDNGPHHESYLTGLSYEPTSFRSYGPFDGTKRDCYEGGIRMPTLAWWPGSIPGGRIDSRPSQFHDWMTTFADLAGTPPPARADGVSLVPTLMAANDLDASAQIPGTVYVEYFNGQKTRPYSDFAVFRHNAPRKQMQVIHVDGYKGVRHDIRSHDDAFEIYDLNVDLGERNNLAGTSDFFDSLQVSMHDRVLRLRRPNDSAKRPYDKRPIPAIAPSESTGALTMTISPGDYPYVVRPPLLASGTNVRVSNGWSDEGLRWFGMDGEVGVGSFHGAIEVPRNGTYTLSFKCSGDSVLRLHDAAVVDTTNQKTTNVETSVELAAGQHPITLDMRLTGDGVVPVLTIADHLGAARPIEKWLVRSSLPPKSFNPEIEAEAFERR